MFVFVFKFWCFLPHMAAFIFSLFFLPASDLSIFRWSRDSNPHQRTMAQIVSPQRLPLDRGASLWLQCLIFWTISQFSRCLNDSQFLNVSMVKFIIFGQKRRLTFSFSEKNINLVLKNWKHTTRLETFKKWTIVYYLKILTVFESSFVGVSASAR